MSIVVIFIVAFQLGFSDVRQMRYALNPLRWHQQLLHSSSNVDIDGTPIYKFITEDDRVDLSRYRIIPTSLSVHNDYCQHFIDTGKRPQNFIRNVGRTERFGEFPRLKELIQLKVQFQSK